MHIFLLYGPIQVDLLVSLAFTFALRSMRKRARSTPPICTVKCNGVDLS